jgi:hypothetical protein
VLHTGAYWLLLKVRGNISKLQPLATAEFKTLEMRLIKIAARISEPRRGCALLAQKPNCSVAWCAASNPPDHDPGGVSPCKRYVPKTSTPGISVLNSC